MIVGRMILEIFDSFNLGLFSLHKLATMIGYDALCFTTRD